MVSRNVSTSVVSTSLTKLKLVQGVEFLTDPIFFQAQIFRQILGAHSTGQKAMASMLEKLLQVRVDPNVGHGCFEQVKKFRRHESALSRQVFVDMQDSDMTSWLIGNGLARFMGRTAWAENSNMPSAVSTMPLNSAMIWAGSVKTVSPMRNAWA